MLFNHVAWDVLLLCTITMLVYLLFFGRKSINNRVRLSVVIFRGLLFASIVGAIAFTVIVGWKDANSYVWLERWRRVGEIGHSALWLYMAQKAVPFAVIGFCLPFAYPRFRTVRQIFFMSIILALVVGIIRAVLNSFDVDELVYIVVGAIMGFSFATLLAWIFPKRKIFSSIGFTKKTHIFGVFYLMAMYFVCFAALLLSNGKLVNQLKLPQIQQPLPKHIELKVQLDDHNTKVENYQEMPLDLDLDIKRIATAIGITGAVDLQAHAEQTNGKPTVAEIKDGNKSLTLDISGLWQYHDADAEEAQGDVPDDSFAIEQAKKFALNGAARGYGVAAAEIEDTVTDETGKIIQKKIYIRGEYGGHEIIGSSEFFIHVGANGAIVFAEKYDHDFKVHKAIKVMSPKQAFDYLMDYVNGKSLPDGVSVSHNLFQPVERISVLSATIAYWPEESNGLLQPIWMFQGTAQNESGDEKEAKLFVSAQEP